MTINGLGEYGTVGLKHLPGGLYSVTDRTGPGADITWASLMRCYFDKVLVIPCIPVSNITVSFVRSRREPDRISIAFRAVNCRRTVSLTPSGDLRTKITVKTALLLSASLFSGIGVAEAVPCNLLPKTYATVFLGYQVASPCDPHLPSR